MQRDLLSMDRDFIKLPMDWVDRIFTRLSFIYKDRWHPAISDEKEWILKSMWSTALGGLDADAIKRGIAVCESFPNSDIPNHIEFYHYAAGNKSPLQRNIIQKFERGSQEVASKYIAEIKSKLNKRGST